MDSLYIVPETHGRELNLHEQFLKKKTNKQKKTNKKTKQKNINIMRGNLKVLDSSSHFLVEYC